MGMDLLFCRFAWRMADHGSSAMDPMYSSRNGMRKLTNSSM
jgi:hypothetical protein